MLGLMDKLETTQVNIDQSNVENPGEVLPVCTNSANVSFTNWDCQFVFPRLAVKLKTLVIAFIVIVLCGAVQAQAPAWKAQNDLQGAAEEVRLSFQRDFDEVVKIHYSNATKEENARLINAQVKDASRSTALMKKFAGALSQAVADKRCSQLCMAQINPLLRTFSDIDTTVMKLNQEEIVPEMLPLVRSTFDIQQKNCRTYIRAIQLKS